MDSFGLTSLRLVEFGSTLEEFELVGRSSRGVPKLGPSGLSPGRLILLVRPVLTQEEVIIVRLGRIGTAIEQETIGTTVAAPCNALFGSFI